MTPRTLKFAETSGDKPRPVEVHSSQDGQFELQLEGRVLAVAGSRSTVSRGRGFDRRLRKTAYLIVDGRAVVDIGAGRRSSSVGRVRTTARQDGNKNEQLCSRRS